jgi:predicted HTH domain antitoxin
MQIEIPDDLGITEEQARLDFAVGLYSSGAASLARSPARWSQPSRVPAHRCRARIPLAYNTDDLDKDIATLNRLGWLADR